MVHPLQYAHGSGIPRVRPRRIRRDTFVAIGLARRAWTRIVAFGPTRSADLAGTGRLLALVGGCFTRDVSDVLSRPSLILCVCSRLAVGCLHHGNSGEGMELAESWADLIQYEDASRKK